MSHLPHTWAHHIHHVLCEYNIQHDRSLTKEAWKNSIRKPTSIVGKATIMAEASNFSKLSLLLASKETYRCEEYLTKLPQHKARLIFKARTRMLNIKNNFRNGRDEILCDLCHKDVEDDRHIFNDCGELVELRGDIQHEELFRADTTIERLSVIADFIVGVEKKLRKL